MVSTPLKNISHNGNLPQIGMKLSPSLTTSAPVFFRKSKPPSLRWVLLATRRFVRRLRSRLSVVACSHDHQSSSLRGWRWKPRTAGLNNSISCCHMGLSWFITAKSYEDFRTFLKFNSSAPPKNDGLEDEPFHPQILSWESKRNPSMPGFLPGNEAATLRGLSYEAHHLSLHNHLIRSDPTVFLGFARESGVHNPEFAVTCVINSPTSCGWASKNRGTPKWMVYNGKPCQNGWFGGTPISETSM